MRFLLLLLSAAELSLITFRINYYGPYKSPLLLLGCSLGIALIYIFSKPRPAEGRKTRLLSKALTIACFLGVSAAMIYKTWRMNTVYPVSINDISRSDIIPQIMHFVSRFVNGSFPYEVIQFPTYQLSPTYLPFTWMPFTLAEWLHADYRWVPFCLFWCTSVFFMCRALTATYSFRTLAEILVVSLWPLAVWCAIVREEDILIAISVETLMAAYYLLLSMSLDMRKGWLLGLAASFCLLSRYSLIFWLPLALLIIVLSGQKRKALLVSGIMLAAVMLFYVIPFLTKDPLLFKKGYDYYTLATVDEWRYAENGGFWHLGNGLGLTKWMYRLAPEMPLEAKVALWRKIHLIATLTVTCALFVGYWLNRRRVDANRYLLFSLKIYLAIFYAFVQIPYKYLFVVPVIVSAAVLLSAYRRADVPAHSVGQV